MAANQSFLKIIMIADHNCIRVTKEANVLADLGHELHLVATNLLPKAGPYKTRTKWDTADDIRNILKAFGPGYIIHVHNEPSYMVQVAREAMPKAKIVLDVHDSNYFRNESNEHSWYEEDTAAHMADALVFVSDGCKKRFIKMQGKGFKRPSCVIPSASPKSWSRIGPWNPIGGLVSQGGHVIPDNSDGKGVLNLWRDYTELYTELVAKGIKPFVLCADFVRNKALTEYYANLGVIPGVFQHDDLLNDLGAHDWSLAGNLGGAPVWNYAIPNKFFDALSAGVPIMNLNVPSIAGWIEKYDLGVNVSSVDEMIEHWPEHKQKRANIIANRHHLYMEEFIGRLIKMYRGLNER